MVLKKIDALSCAKVSAVLYAAIGLIVGFLFSVVSFFAWAAGSSGSAGGMFGGFLFGIGSVIILPIFYGVLGFVGVFISVIIFNFVVNYTGGIGMTFEHEMGQQPPANP